jgi:Sugar kinases, ribokinase family
MSTPEIVIVGEILVEMMAVNIGQSLGVPGIFAGPYPSGAPAICADSASKVLGASGKTTLISSVGDDAFANLCLKKLAIDGVDISRVRRRGDKVTGTAFVTYRESGDRDFIFHFRDSAAGMILVDEEDEKIIGTAKLLHIMGCSVSSSTTNLTAIKKAVTAAERAGVKISFDPNIRRELLTDQSYLSAIIYILSKASVVLTGKNELKLLSSTDDIVEAVETLLAGNAEYVAVRDGANPVTLYSRGKSPVYYKPRYNEPVVDTTGAGDIFDGAFLASLILGRNHEDLISIATTAGSMSVTVRGPMEGTHTLVEILPEI